MPRVELRTDKDRSDGSDVIFFDGKATNYSSEGNPWQQTREEMIGFIDVCVKALEAIGSGRLDVTKKYVKKYGISEDRDYYVTHCSDIANHALKFNLKSKLTDRKMLEKLHKDMDPEKEVEKKKELGEYLGL